MAVFAKAGKRVDVTDIVGPIAEFLGRAREREVRVMSTLYTHLPGVATFLDTGIRDHLVVLI
jgi:hypothetical protein